MVEHSEAARVAAIDAALLALQGTDYLYVLIDPALGDLPDAPATVNELPRWGIPISAFKRERRPYLLELGNIESQLRLLGMMLRVAHEEACGEHDDDANAPRRICAWIAAAPGSGARLAHALAFNAKVLLPQGGWQTFRFWDPRIAPHLERLLGQAFWDRVLPTSTQWWCFAAGPEGAPVFSCVGRSQVAEETIDKDYLRLTQRQWQRLNGLGWANRIARLAPGWGLPALPNAMPVFEAIASRALGWGLDEEADILRFAHCALTVHPRFDTHPGVVLELQALGADSDKTFASVAQAWDDTFLDELRGGGWKISDATSATHFNTNHSEAR